MATPVVETPPVAAPAVVVPVVSTPTPVVSSVVTGGAAITGAMLGGCLVWFCQAIHVVPPSAEVAGTFGAVILAGVHALINVVQSRRST